MSQQLIRIRILFLIVFHSLSLLFSGKISFKRFLYAIRKQMIVSSFFKDEKYMKVGAKYFINPFAPYFPSKYFKKMLEHNTIDTFPMKPNYAQISITNVCPCNCFHCHVGNTQQRDKDIPLETIFQTMEDMIDAGFLTLFFVGGEPFSRFDDMLECVKRVGDRIDTRLFTSGVGVTKEKLRLLKEAGLEAIFVSIDHYEEEIHNELRGNKSAFKSACSTIQDAVEAGFYVSAVCCVTGKTARSGEFTKVIDLAESLGAHSIQLNEIRPVGKALDNDSDEVFLSQSDKKILIDYHKKHNKSSRKIATVMPWYNEEADKFGCMATSGQIVYIDSAGNAQPCVLLQASIGNIKETRFKDIWSNFIQKCKYPVNRCIISDLNEHVDEQTTLPLSQAETFDLWDEFTSLEPTDLFKKLGVEGKMKNLDDYAKKYNLNLQAGKDYKTVDNHKIPNKMNVNYFVFGKTMYCKNKFESAPFHEYLHIAQFNKYGTILVILHYLFYITKNYIKFRHFQKAYDAIPFEVEARAYEKMREEKEE